MRLCYIFNGSLYWFDSVFLLKQPQLNYQSNISLYGIFFCFSKPFALNGRFTYFTYMIDYI